jgi:hypothetical protein
MQLGSMYRPEWGLNLLNRSEDPRPLPWKLNVRWTPENLVPRGRREQVAPVRRKMLRYLDAFDLESGLTDDLRTALITGLIKEQVLPTFDAFKTEGTIREMVGDYQHPRHTHTLHGLPRSWWPPDDGDDEPYDPEWEER